MLSSKYHHDTGQTHTSVHANAEDQTDMGCGPGGYQKSEGAALSDMGGLSAAQLARHDREEEGAGQESGAPMVQDQPVIPSVKTLPHGSSACTDCKPLEGSYVCLISNATLLPGSSLVLRNVWAR